MTYKENFVLVVKCKGEILRERDGIVTLPFGSEYSILMKNLDHRRALVELSVDGKDVLDGSRIVIEPEGLTELEGEKINGKVSNKFKFIKKTSEIKEYRGDRIDDGILRAVVSYEEKWDYKLPVVDVHIQRFPSHRYWYDWRFDWPRYTCDYHQVTYSSHSMPYNTSNSVPVGTINSFYSSSKLDNEPLEDEGITVKGSETKQNFKSVSISGRESESVVIILRLRGITDTNKGLKEVKKALTVGSKLVCSSCGKKWKSSNKFCGDCGTYL